MLRIVLPAITASAAADVGVAVKGIVAVDIDIVVAPTAAPAPTATAPGSADCQANPEGDLFRGQTAKIKEGMVFCVTETDKS